MLTFDTALPQSRRIIVHAAGPLQMFSAFGYASGPEATYGNKIFFSFVSELDSEKLSSAIDLAKLLIDELSTRDLITPPTVDEVKN